MQIEEALALFVDAVQAQGLAAKTARTYRDHIQVFIRSLPSEHRDISACRATDINHFLAAQRQLELTETTIYGRYRALDRFFKWCAESEDVGKPRSPFFNQEGKRIIAVRKPAQKPARRAEVDTVDALIDALPRKNWIYLRNRVALRLLRDTGIRLGEAVNVRLADLDLENRVLVLPKTKNREFRSVPFTRTLVSEIEDYLEFRPVCPAGVAEYLFVAAINDNPDNGARNRLTSAGLAMMISKLCERAGLPHTNPHSIRHMFGATALNAGVRLEVVSKIMGHHDPNFTRRFYADLLPDTVKREYDEFWT